MEESSKKENLIVQLTFAFAIKVIDFCAVLEEQKKWSLSNQLLRAAISVGANVREAQNAESKADFIHKMKISAKESEEVGYYFELCNTSKRLPDAGCLLNDFESSK